MAESKDMVVEADVIESSEPASPISPNAPKAKTGLLWFVVILAMLLSVGGLGGGYWYLEQKLATISELESTNALQQSALNTLNAQNESLQNQINSVESDSATRQTAIARLNESTLGLEQQNANLQDKLAGINGRRPSDWLIAEADYLVRMAGRKLWLEHDVRTAIMLLDNADVRLSELGDPSVIPVRTFIAQDIQRLKQVNDVAHVSIALAISGLLGQVDSLPLDYLEFRDPNADAQAAQMSESVSDWKDNLAVVWRNIVDDFISHERVDTPIKPFMNEQQRWLAKEQLSLYLLQAQAAATQAQDTLYKQSLQQALGLLVEHYDLTTPEVSGFMSSVQNLNEMNVSRSLPSELSAQRPLSDLLNDRVDSVIDRGVQAL